MTDKILTAARKRLEKALEDEEQIRRSAEEDILFESGEQWDAQDRFERESYGRPCLVINKCAPVLKQIVGDARKNRPRIKVRPVDDKTDPQLARMLTGLVKNIENNSDAEGAYDWGFECAARGGFGYWRVNTEYSTDDAFDQDITIKRVTNQFSVVIDPDAFSPAGEDAKYAFIIDEVLKTDFEAEYPGKEVSSLDFQELGYESDEDHIRIAEYFYTETRKKTLFLLADGRSILLEKPEVYQIPTLEGMVDVVDDNGVPMPFTRTREIECDVVKWCKISGSEIIEGPQDWGGRYIPIVRCIGEEVWVQGKRQFRSAIYHAKDPSRLYNWARSTSAETLALAPKQPYLLTPEEVEGHEEQWNEAHRKPMPYLLHNDAGLGRPTRQAPSLSDPGALNEAQLASDDIKATTGIFDASLGAQGNETSGKAIMARQAEGDNATFVFHDNLSKAVRHTGRIVVDLIPKIYDTERVVRILNEDGTDQAVTINQQQPGGGILNDVSAGKYDVYVDIGPSYATQRVEAADGMIQFMQAFPQSAPIVGPRLAKNLDWPEAQDIAEELKALTQQPPSPEQQIETAKGQMEVQGMELDNAKKQQELMMAGPEQAQQMYQVATKAVTDILKQIGLLR